MADSLESVFAEVEAHLRSPLTLVRVVLSGRRRNMQTPAERIDIRPVLIKEELYLQVAHTDGRQMTTKNYLPLDFDAQSFLQAGFANVLVEHTEGTLTLRISKKVIRSFIEPSKARNKSFLMTELRTAYSIQQIHFSLKWEFRIQLEKSKQLNKISIARLKNSCDFLYRRSKVRSKQVI